MSSPIATPTRYIGLDLHKHYLIALALDPSGEQTGGPWRVALDRLDDWARQHLTRLEAVAVAIPPTPTPCMMHSCPWCPR
jgi:hypothetical protein